MVTRKPENYSVDALGFEISKKLARVEYRAKIKAIVLVCGFLALSGCALNSGEGDEVTPEAQRTVVALKTGKQLSYADIVSKQSKKRTEITRITPIDDHGISKGTKEELDKKRATDVVSFYEGISAVAQDASLGCDDMAARIKTMVEENGKAVKELVAFQKSLNKKEGNGFAAAFGEKYKAQLSQAREKLAEGVQRCGTNSNLRDVLMEIASLGT
jgi:hypothetical protein